MTINDHLNKHGYNSHSKFELIEENLSELKMRLLNAEESTRYQYPDKTAALEGYQLLADKFFNDY